MQWKTKQKTINSHVGVLAMTVFGAGGSSTSSSEKNN